MDLPLWILIIVGIPLLAVALFAACVLGVVLVNYGPIFFEMERRNRKR